MSDSKTSPNTSTAKNLFGYEKNPSNILPKKYTLDSKIKFRCYPGISCFTACCGNIKIILTPFDILRIRREINLSAQEFLLRFTRPVHLEKTDLPGVELNLDEDGRCPFVTPEGCTIYSVRPTTCRYYPVGMANFHEGKKENQTAEEFYFLVKEPHCKGHEEEKEWTIREWRKDQGVDISDEMNKDWMEIIMRRKSFGLQATMSEEGKKIFFMVSTDLDRFRDLIFNSSFLDTYEVDQATLDQIKKDDKALLKFSYRFLNSTLFGAQDLKIKEEKIKAKSEEIKIHQSTAEKRAEETYKELKAERDKMIQEQNKSKEKK
ncbi:MAG: YkgJ family cysteine cluster protein [Proteobacteria bacterium]|nr:YkgJ family cysteine cluster protein [Pseudomonadota bacterium]MBU1710829.1 YkgJ family cysteine cluster protein [Pseudomonadota bacterium]